MKKIILASILGLLATSASAQQPTIMGTWLTASGVAKVQLAPCENPASGALCGFVTGLVNPKGPDGVVVAPEIATDYRNADSKLRDRKVIGMALMWGFKKTSDPNVFEGGNIYNGEDGKTYSANVSLQADGKLRLRGYIGTPMFGETQIWTRIQ